MTDRRKPETRRQADIVRELERMGYLVIRIQSGTVRVRRGWLDARGVSRGARPPKRLFPIWPRPERHVGQPPYLELDGIRRSRQVRRPWAQEELPW